VKFGDKPPLSLDGVYGRSEITGSSKNVERSPKEVFGIGVWLIEENIFLFDGKILEIGPRDFEIKMARNGTRS